MEKTVEIMEKNRIADLFAGWEETLIWSCLQDCMGRAFADSLENPRSAQILVGDFCFLQAGRQNLLCGINRMTGNRILSLWYRLQKNGHM